MLFLEPFDYAGEPQDTIRDLQRLVFWFVLLLGESM